jgi:hypothetical protein
MLDQVEGLAQVKGLVQIKSARGHVAAVRAALQSPWPEELGRGIPRLNEAIVCLEALEPGRDPRKADLAQELSALRFELGVVRRLVAGGAEFYRGWARILAMAAGSYTPTGDPAPLTAPGSVSVEG